MTIETIWLITQLIIGFNLLMPFILFVVWSLTPKSIPVNNESIEYDYAIIVTAYEYVNTLPAVVNSILKLDYDNYLVYIVADNCDISNLSFNSEKVKLLRPDEVLSSNTRSHAYAISCFERDHDYLTIIDSDNILDTHYLNNLNIILNRGYTSVQGLRAAKNLDSTIACLDAARDIYYHFYDGKLLFESGSSATLSGSGMAFKVSLYKEFLANHNVSGAGFDKVLQSWLVGNNQRIAFTELAVVYDEKTSKSEQLVQQRSRWINTWFKYFSLGFNLIFSGISGFNRNKFLFGLILLRPPLFIFLLLSIFFCAINLLIGNYVQTLIWIVSLCIFVLFFLVSLWRSETDTRIYQSLKNIPKFVFYQVASLLKAGRANKLSVSTKHYHDDEQIRKDGEK